MISQAQYAEVVRERDLAVILAAKALDRHMKTISDLTEAQKELDTTHERLETALMDIEILKDTIAGLRDDIFQSELERE